LCDPIIIIIAAHKSRQDRTPQKQEGEGGEDGRVAGPRGWSIDSIKRKGKKGFTRGKKGQGKTKRKIEEGGV
jgi:hypothetical protein